MGSRSLRNAALIVCALTLTLPGWAQARFVPSTADTALTYVAERGKIADNTGCNCFWLKGAGVDAGVPVLYRGLSLAASLNGGTAANIKPGVGLSTIAYLFGPRYTLTAARAGRYHMRYPVKVFGEALFGGVHGFNSIFPGASSANTSANGFALQLGGGLDVPIAHGFGVRAIQLDYFRSTLPNGDSNTQNDLKLAFGVIYHFSKRAK